MEITQVGKMSSSLVYTYLECLDNIKVSTVARIKVLKCGGLFKVSRKIVGCLQSLIQIGMVKVTKNTGGV